MTIHQKEGRLKKLASATEPLPNTGRLVAQEKSSLARIACHVATRLKRRSGLAFICGANAGAPLEQPSNRFSYGPRPSDAVCDFQ